MNQIKLGSIVKAIAGRDDGYYFIIIQIIDDEYVLIANGDNRTMANPKKKKIKHLKPTGILVDSIADKLKDSKKVFDSEIFSAIKKVCSEN